MRFIKTVVILLIFFITPLAVASNAYAAVDPFSGACSNADPNNLPSICQEDAANSSKTATDLNPLSGKDGILLRVVKLLAFATGLASIVIIILSGLKYVTADGDSNTISSAKRTMLYAFVGLVVSMAGQGIIYFVVNAIN